MDTIREKIKRYISGKFSFNDYLSVSSYFHQEEFNDELKDAMEGEWSATVITNENKERLDQLLNGLHHRINIANPSTRNSAHNLYSFFSKIAVALLIPALITIAVLSYISLRPTVQVDSWAEIHSPLGARTKFGLPDGTQGWLNSGSSIKYSVSFRQRSVEISGEAWFDVAHLKEKDFRVITPSFDVKVVGTQFNVVAYEDEPTANVILERGKVLILGKDQTVKGELLPDQQIVYDKTTRDIQKTSIDSKSYTSWKDGLLVFKNVPMEEMAKRLERRYNAEIILHGDSLKASIFRATFLEENLDEICKMLATVAPIRYKIHSREKLPNNTFTKGKVEMWLKKSTNLN